jgi:hypothetical protein
MKYYVNIDFADRDRDSINLYNGTSDRLAHVYLDIAHLLIASFDAPASISYANADSSGVLDDMLAR